MFGTDLVHILLIIVYLHNKICYIVSGVITALTRPFRLLTSSRVPSDASRVHIPSFCSHNYKKSGNKHLKINILILSKLFGSNIAASPKTLLSFIIILLLTHHIGSLNIHVFHARS